MNQQRGERAIVALQELLTTHLVRGMHGTVAIEIAIQDGTIQHLRERIERWQR